MFTSLLLYALEENWLYVRITKGPHRDIGAILLRNMFEPFRINSGYL